MDMGHMNNFFNVKLLGFSKDETGLKCGYHKRLGERRWHEVDFCAPSIGCAGWGGNWSGLLRPLGPPRNLLPELTESGSEVPVPSWKHGTPSGNEKWMKTSFL